VNLEASDYNVEKLFVNGLHVFFTNKTRFIYDHFLHWLVVTYNINNIQSQHVHEEAMISALQNQLPDVRINYILNC